MIRAPYSSQTRPLLTQSISTDLVVIGGGIAGTCTAISAAREGLKVVLVQDRPVLGGNGSSEVRLWWLGATCHGMTNNRWAREAGIVNELLLQNLYDNPESNPELVDVILLDAVVREPNITLLLNTAVDALEMAEADTIRSVSAFCSQNSTRYTLESPIFSDCSGDGIVGFMAGAAFRMGAEPKEEFDEALAPDEAFGELLGDSIYFYTKDAGRPVPFKAPSFAPAIKPDEIRMMKYFNLYQQGCQLWWVESGGRRDTVHEAEIIKWDLWKIIYGIWDYIKNSGNFPDAENLTLEWVGKIPGKREARRFEGDYMLKQQDVIHPKPLPDAVGFGGWSIDLHPADGLFSKLPSAIQYAFRSLYPIPYRCLYSRNIKNLFLGGRTLSASHVAFGSTRVMCTLGQLGEAIGVAAALSKSSGQQPAEIDIPSLQRKLLQRGFHLPLTELVDETDLAQQAKLTGSSTWQPIALPANDEWLALEKAQCQLLPIQSGKLPEVSLPVKASCTTSVTVEWRIASRPESQTPDVLLAEMRIELPQGESSLIIPSEATLPADGYAYLILRDNPDVAIALSDQRATGLIRLFRRGEQRNGDSHEQHLPAEEAGCEAMTLWYPERRPQGKNLALRLNQSLAGYDPENIRSQHLRPTTRPNAWVADPNDPAPVLTLAWDEPQTITKVRVFLDPDWDHPIETVIKRHSDRIMPSLAKDLELLDADGNCLGIVTDNRSPHIDFTFEAPCTTDELSLKINAMNSDWPAAIFAIRVW